VDVCLPQMANLTLLDLVLGFWAASSQVTFCADIPH
jgi:hypothetical protein